MFVIYAALLMLLLSGSRASFRLISEFAQRATERGLRVAIYGAGDVAARVSCATSRAAGRGLRMLGFIVEDPARSARRCRAIQCWVAITRC